MKPNILIFLISIFFLYSCDIATQPTHVISAPEYLPVKKIVDGDTFWADDGTPKGIKIRLIGIDAPESRKSFKKEVGIYGKESKAYLTRLLKGKKVRLVYDVDLKDQYGRTLAYVYLEDGTFVNAEIIKNGFATILTIPPNVKFADHFYQLQQRARESKKGLWNVSP